MVQASALVVLLLMPGLEPAQSERLDNGLRIVVVEDHALPLVSVQLWFHVGSADDPRGRPGLCHVARTLLERSSDAHERLRAAGLRCEARTLRDASCFAVVLPPDFLRCVLPLAAEYLSPPTVTPEGLRAALAAARTSDTPEDPLLAALFPGHPYDHRPEFVAPGLGDVAPAEVEAFLRRWFVPANATVVIVGDVAPAEALALARRNFGQAPWAEPPRRRAARLPPAERQRISAPGASRRVEFAWLAPPAGMFESAALDVLLHRLCNPIDGPLARRLASLGWSPPGWRHEVWRDAGVVTLSLARSDEQDAARVEQIEQVVRAELEAATRAVPAEIAFNRARALARRDALRRHAAFGERAGRIGWYAVVTGNPQLADAGGEFASAVAVADMQAAARALLGARMVAVTGALASTATAAPTMATVQTRSEHAGPDCLAVPPRVRPPGETLRRQVGREVELVLCDAPGLSPASVRTLVISAGESTTQVPENLLENDSPRHSAVQLQDYLTYHGLDLSVRRENSRLSGLDGRGDGALAPQMIELQAEWLRPHAVPAAGIRIVVVGDVAPEAVIAAAELTWRGWAGTVAGSLERASGQSATPTMVPEPGTAGYVAHLLSLDSAAAIADRLEAGQADPWQPHPPPTSGASP